MIPVGHWIALAIWTLLLVLPRLEAARMTKEFSADREYITKNWQTADGLPQNIIQAIQQTRDGYLWLGTQTGLARFDGVRFTTFTTANTPGLLSDFVWRLLEDREGTLWIGTRRGIAKRIAGVITSSGAAEGLPEAPANSFAEDAAGTLWAVVGSRLYRRVGGRFEVVNLGPANEPQAVRAIRVSNRGELWVVARGKLWRRLGDGFETVAVLEDEAVMDFAFDARDHGWLSSINSGLTELRDGSWVSHGRESIASPFRLYFARDGGLWVTSAATNKLFHLRAGHIRALGTDDGLPGNNATAVAEDDEGNYWVGMNGTGLFRLRSRRMEVFDTRNGLPTLKLTSLAADAEGRVLAGVDSQGIFRLDAGRFDQRANESTVPDSFVPASLLRLAGGEIAVGTFFGDLKFWDGQRVTRRTGGAGGTRVLMAARDGSLWRGTRRDGVEHHTGDTVATFSEANGLSLNEVLCLAQDAAGAVWAGTERGLNRIADGHVTVFKRANGLRSDYIAALFADSRGTLWAGTLGGGLAALRDGKFVTITTREGLAHDSVTQIIEDDFGNLWLGTRAGLMRASLDDLHAFLAGKVRYIHGTRFARDDGLAPADCGTDNQPSSLKTADGRLWFCTASGVVVVNPREIAANNRPPRVHVEEFTVDGSVFDPANAAVPAGRRRVEIRYTGISFSAPTLVRFRHRLEGYDADWVEAGEQRAAQYVNLPPGDYAFHVTACNSDGVWNDTGTSIAFTVLPAVWQTNLFRLVAAATVLVLGAFIMRARVARVERKRAQKEALARQLIDRQEAERKRIAAEIHDGLGQSLMVVKNRALMGLRGAQEPSAMAVQLEEINGAVTQAIAEAREISFNLRPHQLDSLGLAQGIRAMAAKACAAANLKLVTDISADADALPAESRVHVFRIAQECLNNAVKHAGAKQVRLQLVRADDRLRLAFEDDGQGYDPAASAGDAEHGFGSATLRERVLVLGGVLRTESAPGRGTRVIVEFPLPAVREGGA